MYLFKQQKSQFFIIYEQQPHLDNMHTVFGQVLDGWDTLDKWERLPVWGEKAPSRSQKTTPLEPPEIVAITIHANPLADNGITYPTPDGPPEKK
jgi:peptidyl-prolyl cis-trans isomerase-like 3